MVISNVGKQGGTSQKRLNVLDKSCDIIDTLDVVTGGRPLSTVFFAAMQRHRLFERLQACGMSVDHTSLRTFLCHLEDGYGNNMYAPWHHFPAARDAIGLLSRRSLLKPSS